MSVKIPKRAPTIHSERVVVDEVFDDGVVRLLRAKHKASKKDALTLDLWQDETIDVMKTKQVEAFVGFTAPRKLREGDVFYLVDGRLLNDDYKPIGRKQARLEHLLLDWDKGREFAREEIKYHVRMLNVKHAESGTETDRQTIARLVDRSFAGPKSRKE
ncbi:MAG TPA: hypothetical protein PK961_02405 [bacterium]|nr:hypothetical protein [bacterium]